MFYKSNNDGYTQVLPGIKLKTLVHGDKTLFTEFRLGQGSQLPPHAHPQEQTGYLIAGRIRLFIGNEVFEVEPGDSWCVPSNVEHRLRFSLIRWQLKFSRLFEKIIYPTNQTRLLAKVSLPRIFTQHEKISFVRTFIDGLFRKHKIP
jgi:hypothetical protein